MTAGLLAGALGLAGCAGPSGGPAGTGGSAGAVTGTVVVFAAASLTESFHQISRDFEAAHPGVTVTLNLAGSSGLARQIDQGAPADVFASASDAVMRQVTDAGSASGAPTVFARNQLVIAVAKGNSRRVTGLAGLARPGLTVARCAEQVPCGAAATAVLAAAGVRLTPVSVDPDVRAALSKVKLGEVDAALVYRTDVMAAAGEVDAVEFPESARAVNEYPIVALREAPNPAAAAAFVEYVQAGPARAVLVQAGFQVP